MKAILPGFTAIVCPVQYALRAVALKIRHVYPYTTIDISILFEIRSLLDSVGRVLYPRQRRETGSRHPLTSGPLRLEGCCLCKYPRMKQLYGYLLRPTEFLFYSAIQIYRLT